MGSGLELKPASNPPDLEDGDSDLRVETMVEWFHENFEDPAQHTPYESAEGGYQYIWGGPYDAREQVGSAFPEASDEEIDAAIDEIESDGIVYWAPRDTRIQPEDDSYVPDLTEPPLSEQLAALGPRLDIVEAWLDAFEQTAVGMGHNQPPAEFRLAPDEDELAELRQSIADVRKELAKADPADDGDPELVERARTRFARFLTWLKKVVVAGMVIFGASVLEGAGNEAWQNPHQFYGHVASITHTLTGWAGHLQQLF